MSVNGLNKQNKKAFIWKWSGTTTRLNKGEKSAKVQRKTVKDLQKAWRTVSQDHFKRLSGSLAHRKWNKKKWGVDQNFCPVRQESKTRSEILFNFTCTARQVSCILAVPHLQSENRMRTSFVKEVPSCQSQLYLLLSWTAVASISHSLPFSVSRTDNKIGAGYSTLPLCISLFFEHSHFSFRHLSVPIIPFSYTVTSKVNLVALITSPHCACPGQKS